ncbi:MAG: GNAT family N-acetyltransferase [Candidatus Promineifilaceae bacterium]
MNDLRRIEEVSLDAWPALHTFAYDGWLLRFANGYTKRANSVTPLYAGELPAAEKIRYCEEQYWRRALRPIFRLALIHPEADLDRLLADAAYQRVDVTSVQGLEIGRGFRASTRTVVAPLNTWLRAFHLLNPARRDERAHEAILQQIAGPICPLILMNGTQPLACGLAVVQQPYVGLFDIVTEKDQRRKGYGRELTESLIAWGREHGASYAYLQVMRDNSPALALYEQLGFSELYRYWYRLAPNSGKTTAKENTA